MSSSAASQRRFVDGPGGEGQPLLALPPKKDKNKRANEDAALDDKAKQKKIRQRQDLDKPSQCKPGASSLLLRGSGARPLDQDWSSKTNCPKTGGVVERDDHEASENGAGDPLLRGEVEARTF